MKSYKFEMYMCLPSSDNLASGSQKKSHEPPTGHPLGTRETSVRADTTNNMNSSIKKGGEGVFL